DVLLGRASLAPEEAAKHRPFVDTRRSPWHNDPPSPSDPRYRATARLMKKLEVEAVKKSNVISIAYEGPSPNVSQAVVATLVDLYLAQHVRLNRTPGAHQFLSDQTAQLRAKLTRAEEDLGKLKSDTGLTSVDVQRQLLVNRLGKLEDDLLQAEG